VYFSDTIQVFKHKTKRTLSEVNVAAKIKPYTSQNFRTLQLHVFGFTEKRVSVAEMCVNTSKR
jgi:hypothetical protein